MNKVSERFAKFCEVLDTIAGFTLLLIMGLVTANVLLRSILKSPISGTYDYVGLLTSIVIGLSLAYCAVHKGHIAIDYFIEKMPVRVQGIIDIIMGAAAGAFLIMASWQLAKTGYNMVLTGQKSPSAMIPYYPFIYVVAFGMFILALVVIIQINEPLRKVTKK